VLPELVRVLRPGGHLVLSDSRGILEDVGVPMVNRLPDGRFGYLPNHPWRASQYLSVALPLGLQVRRCLEPVRPSPLVRSDGAPTTHHGEMPPYDPGDPGDIWSLHRFAVEAANAVYRDKSVAIIWHFQLAG
jgi:hypothetical protein